MIVLYNPHVDDFLATPPHFKLLKRRALKKYGFIIEGILNQSGKIDVLVDGTISVFLSPSLFDLLPYFIRILIARAEFSCWKYVNGLSKKCEIVDVGQGDYSNSTLLMFSYKASTGRLFRKRCASLSVFRAVIVHLSHYFIATREKSDNLSRIQNVWLAGDSDISCNPYFQHFFPWYKRRFLVLNFAVSARFRMIKKYDDRSDACVATGSFHDLSKEIPKEKYSDFQDFFGQNTYHPIRKYIYDNQQGISENVKSYVSPYRNYEESNRIWRKFRHFIVNQKSYFAVDIVELYNEFRFAVVGEEGSGFPALGAFEAMVCGAVLIADSRAYIGLGLEDGKHYLSHDGSVENILAVIKKAQKDEMKLKEISKNGVRFIDQNMRSAAAFRSLIKLTEDLTGDV